MSAVILWVGRALLPFSLLVALVFMPSAVLRPADFWRVICAMWDDPL